MKNCLFCNKQLTHIEGRKQKSFCNVNCRNKYFYSKRKKLIEKALLVETTVQDFTKPTNEVKPFEQPKTNYAIKTDKHPLWKDGDPKEGSMAFLVKYDCSTYEELEKKKAGTEDGI